MEKEVKFLFCIKFLITYNLAVVWILTKEALSIVVCLSLQLSLFESLCSNLRELLLEGWLVAILVDQFDASVSHLASENILSIRVSHGHIDIAWRVHISSHIADQSAHL